MRAEAVAFDVLLEDGTTLALDVAPDALGYHVVRDGRGVERTINAADPWSAVAGVARSMRLPSPLAVIRRRPEWAADVGRYAKPTRPATPEEMTAALAPAATAQRPERHALLEAVAACADREREARAAWLASLPPGACASPPPGELTDAEAATAAALAALGAEGAR